MRGRTREESRVVGDAAPAGTRASVRTWAWRVALSAGVLCLTVAVFRYTEFLATPPSGRIYGIYYGLRESGDAYLWYALFWLLVGEWVRRLSVRLALATGIAMALLVLNVAFAWSSGSLAYVLAFLPVWFPQRLIIDYLAIVQFPTVRTALDLYYVGWLGLLFLLLMAFFRSPLATRMVRSLELASLALLALPVEVYLFDTREFNLHVMDAQVGTYASWFTNADLLASLIVVLSALAVVDGLITEHAERAPGLRNLSGPGGI